MDDHFSLALWTGWMLNGSKFLLFWPKLHKWHFHTIVVALTSIYAEIDSEIYSLNNISPVPDDIDYLGKVLVRADCIPAYFDEYLKLKRYNNTSNHALIMDDSKAVYYYKRDNKQQSIRQLLFYIPLWSCFIIGWIIFAMNLYTHFSPLLQQIRKEKIPHKSQNVEDTKSHRQLQTCVQTSIPCKKPLQYWH